jgi:tetratricopeptide (TPR) repeat protein/CHAT domain-containing protein
MVAGWFRGAILSAGLLLSCAATVSAESLDEVRALNNEVMQLYQVGKYAEAVELAKKSLTLAEQKLGAEHLELAQSLYNLGLVDAAQARYGEAEQLYKRSLAIRENAIGSEHPDVAQSLHALATLYRIQGRLADAEPLLRRSLAIRERALDPNHLDIAQSLNDLGLLLQMQGRYAEAEPLYQRSLAIYETAVGPAHPWVAQLLNNLAAISSSQGRYGEAEQLYQRSLAIRENTIGPEHPDVAQSLHALGGLYRIQGRLGRAEPLLRRSLAIRERALGPNHLDVAQSLNELGLLLRLQGRYAEAEPLYRRSLAIYEQAVGHGHPLVAQLLNNLAALSFSQGRYGEAEPLYKRALDINEKALGFDHPDVALALTNLAVLYQAQGRLAEAEPFFQRGLAIREKAFGVDHPVVGQTLGNLAALYFAEGRFAQAEPLYMRGLAILEKAFGANSPDVATLCNNLAAVYQLQGRFAEAEPLYRRSLEIREKVLTTDHPDVAVSLNNLAELEGIQGRYAEAEQLHERSLAIREKTLNPDHPLIGQSLNNLAKLKFAQEDWAGSVDYWRRGTAVLLRRALRGTADVGQAVTGKGKSEAEQLRYEFWGQIKAAHRLAKQAPLTETKIAEEMFQTAQWALGSEAAASLAQMAARGAKGNAALAALVRERQDLVEEWQKRDATRSAAIGQAPDKRDNQTEAANLSRLASLDARIAEIDGRLAAQFPEYTALTRPGTLSVQAVQAQLANDEALVLFLDTPIWKPAPEETFIWVVTKTGMRWVRTDLGTSSIEREVAALRCGLDYDGTWSADGLRCSELLKTANTASWDRRSLPFDVQRAHVLYTALLGGIEDVIKDKHLFIVPSGALTQLPFQVLVTHEPDPTASGSATFQRAAWLIRSHALTVLPSVSSLKALRQLARGSHASRPLIGFGNPLLDGPDAGYAKWASEARSKQSCPKAPKEQLAALTAVRRTVQPLKLRSGLVDVATVRSQVPLPETADELCAVAHDLGVMGNEIRLGQRATETEIKRLSTTGELAKYRVIHFATHGALAGQIGDGSEPGLLLTPPKTPTDGDDGYLSASEITALKLNADWVILSACNTAAGNAEGAEALSGLARAFFYAGARALLVSHWAVYSDATVKLITGAVGRMVADTRVGRAEAMRQSMLAMIDKGDSYEAHPAYWAPFIVVGEGAAR